MFTTRKLINLLLLSVSLIILSGFSSSEYTRKVKPLPNMPKGNPDLSLGIVVYPNSTGIDVLRNSSQNIRFTATKNYEKTDIEVLRSSSKVDRNPKKLNFIDKKHGFFSDSVYEFSIMFDYKNHHWKQIKFMPYNFVYEWVTRDQLMVYLNKWATIFSKAGWKSNLSSEHDFTIPISPSSYNKHQFGSWETKDYKATIWISVRDPEDYKYYLPKEQRKNTPLPPNGYIAIIKIYKKSQYLD